MKVALTVPLGSPCRSTMADAPALKLSVTIDQFGVYRCVAESATGRFS